MTIEVFDYPEYRDKANIIANAMNESIPVGETVIFQNLDITKAIRVAILIQSDSGDLDILIQGKDPVNLNSVGASQNLLQITAPTISGKTQLFDFDFTHMDVKINNFSAGAQNINLFVIGKEFN